MGALNLSLASIAKALGVEVKQNQTYVMAPGPGHSSEDRSLKVTPDGNAPDGFLVHSFAGDDWQECKDYVRDKIGLPRQKLNGGKTPPTEYIYRDENGEPYGRVSRTEDKEFPQAHWDGKQWQWGAPKGPKIPYRLPQLLNADAVFIVEGEKDADRLATIGLVATTNTEGADNGTGKKWTAELNKWFAGKTVYILPDNDKPGRKHATHVANNLHGVAREVRVVELPGLPLTS